MGLGKLQQQHKRHQARLAEERRRAAEKIQRESEAIHALAREIQQAKKALDRQAALRLGENLTKLCRTRCKYCLDGEGQADASLLAGIVLEANERILHDPSLIRTWVTSGEQYLPRRTRPEVTE